MPTPWWRGCSRRSPFPRPERAVIATKRSHPPEGSGVLLAPELRSRVRQIQIRTHRLVTTALAGGYRSTFRGAGIEFEEVRPYQPGDDVRSIDWNVTARAGEPYIKTFAEERELTIRFLVDTSRSMDFGSRRWTKREAAAQLCALLAFVALRHSDRVGLTLFGEKPGLHVDAKKGTRHALRVVREVIAAAPSGGGSDLAAILEHDERASRRRSVVFLVSDFLEPEGSPERAPWGEALARLARRHDVIAARVVDPLEEELPKAGLLELAELESGRRVELDARSEAVRTAWRKAAQGRREALRSVLGRARVDLLELDTAGDLALPVLSLFRRRQSRYGGRRT